MPLNTIKKRSLSDWLGYLETMHPNEIELGLERTRRVAETAGLLYPTPFVVTVAGTNGKGTTIAALEAILIENGLNVGAYTSPHLLRYNERVRINGEMLRDEAICQSFGEIDRLRFDIPLTYFEFSTLSALWLFKQHSLDVMLLEVGLGGRLDAVNVIDPNLSVLTSIGLDHIDWLGSTLESIATEKVGIARNGAPFINGADNLPDAVLGELIRLASPLVNRFQFGSVERDKLSNDGVWAWQGVSPFNEPVVVCNLPPAKIPLMNAELVLQILQFLPFKVSEQAILTGLANVSLSGRLQWLKSEGSSILVDVAHNEQAAAYLAEQLVSIRLKYDRVIALYSSLKDKDVGAVVKVLRCVVDEWIIAPLNVPRAATLNDLREALALNEIKSSHHFPTVNDALEHLSLINDQNTLILVFGSFYTVAEALQFYGYTE